MYFDFKYFEQTCKLKVCQRVKATTGLGLSPSDLRLVWYAKVLQHYKCILCDTNPYSHRIYECTYNGIINEMYIDIYGKEDSMVIPEAAEVKHD